ncbi:MAG: flagellar M-ring protein FliF [Bacillaceae bacterium]|nr:flagellar M-ring protein FliF [Bacillaceae bacterium]
MGEQLLLYREKIKTFWMSRTTLQKGLLVGSFILLVALLIVVPLLGSKSNMVPLYTNLTIQETGEIKFQLDARGIPSEVTAGGTSILVPETMVDSLKVELAAEGIPRSGSINYDFFKDRMGFGMTDNEFSVIERGLMQTELSNLIRNIDGINNADVIITLPEESIFLSDNDQSAQASVMLNVRPGYQLDQQQVRALYHLVSKSVPKLPIDNIVIMNQNFEYFELKNENHLDSTLSVYEQQRAIQKDIEQDLQRQVQQMLGTIVGRDKVVVAVTTDIDFTKENRAEDLVTPVDIDNMEGLAVSIERITETYSGDDGQAGGIPGTGETDVPGYPGISGSGGGDYERMEERINNEVNRIRREIVHSPYEIRDIGIQVMVEPPDPDDLNSLPLDRLNDIQQILSTIVRTSISKDIVDQLTQEEINDKVFVSRQVFEGKITFDDVEETSFPIWYYVVGGLVVLILLLIVLLLRKNKQQPVLEEMSQTNQYEFDIPNINDERYTEETARRNQLEKMAKDKPEEFSKLVRTWLSEE